MRGLNLCIGGRRARRRLLRAAAAACILLAVLCLTPYFHWLPARLDAALAGHFVPQYTQRFDELRAENLALHTELAALAPLRQENAALRTLIGSGRAGEAAYLPAQLTAYYGGSFTLYTTAAPAQGAEVVDCWGRFAGVVETATGGSAAVAAAGMGAGAVPCTVNGCHGLLQRSGSSLVITGLPRHSQLAAGDIATTLGGQWIGRLSAAPALGSSGLTAAAHLCETAIWADEIYFIVQKE